MFRLIGTISPGGTVTRYHLDPRGLPTAVATGLAGQGPTQDKRTLILGEKIVSAYIYDNGHSGGNGNITRVELHVTDNEDPEKKDGEAKSRRTNIAYDWRDRIHKTTTEGITYSFKHNALNQVIETQAIQKDVTSFVIHEVDSLGRVFRRTQFRLLLGDSLRLTENIWYDSVGNVIMHRPMGATALTKFQFDKRNREVRRYVVVPPKAEVGLQDAHSVSQDTVWEQLETDYDSADNVTSIIHRRRLFDFGSKQTNEFLHDRDLRQHFEEPGELRDKDTWDGGSVCRSSQVRFWHDALGRSRTTADYGTDLVKAGRPFTSIPKRSDQVLVATVEYNSRGEANLLTDPMGHVDASVFDDSGRLRKQIENYSQTPLRLCA